MNKNAITLTILLMFCFLLSNAQQSAKGVTVVMKTRMKYPGMGAAMEREFITHSRDGFVLEPVEINYENQESSVTTDGSTISTKIIDSGKRLRWYCLSDLKRMKGLLFDLDTPSSIKTYKLGVEMKGKMGMGITIEPFLSEGYTIADYTKDKDTLFNGQKCIMLKRDKVVELVRNGKKLPGVLNFRMIIDPSLKSYALPFISEELVSKFGGGAVVYGSAKTEDGGVHELEYSYTEFTPAVTELFNRYMELYKSNIKLLEK